MCFGGYNFKVLSCFLYVVQDRTPGEPFVPKPAKEAEMEKILKSMEVNNAFISQNFVLLMLNFGLSSSLNILQGMPGAPGMKMYSRDDLMNMKNFGNEDADDDDEDDDDEDTLFPSKLVIRNFQLSN